MWTINPKFAIFKEKFDADIYIYCGQPTYACTDGLFYLGNLTSQEISDLVTQSVDEGTNYVFQNAIKTVNEENFKPVCWY